MRARRENKMVDMRVIRGIIYAFSKLELIDAYCMFSLSSCKRCTDRVFYYAVDGEV